MFWTKRRTNDKPKKKSKVVIIGAGFAGLSAARELESRDDVDVTIVDRTNHHLFQPLLYQVATGGLNASEIASPIRSLFKGSKRTSVLLGSLTDVDRENRTVTLDNGRRTLDYDYLVMAVGGRTSYFGNDHWELHAPGLKSLTDAERIKERVLLAFEKAETEEDPEERRRLMTVAVIGGGPTGVEMAGALAELRRHVLSHEFKNIKPEDAKIVLVEGGSRLLPSFPNKCSENALAELEKMGVEVLTEHMVKDIGPGIVETSKDTLKAENIIWAAGVGGHPLAYLTGGTLDRAGRVNIDKSLQVPGQERIFCLGDMARFEDKNGQPLPGVAPVAMQQGRHAARNITRLLDGKKTKAFRYLNKGSMATIGRSSAVAVVPGGFTMSGWPAWLGWLGVHLLYIADLQNRLMVLVRWGWAYLGWKWNVRLIPGEAPVDYGELEPVRGS